MKTDFRLVDLEEAAKVIGVSSMTIRRLIKAKIIPAYRAGRKVLRVNIDEVLKVMRRNEA